MVLQKTVPQDNGSFYFLSTGLGPPYCNNEVSNGNFNKQMEMHLFLREILP